MPEVDLPPIAYADLMERLTDPDSDLDYYMQYLIEVPTEGRMAPELAPNPALVTDIPPEVEGGFLISFANGFMRRRRHRAYRRRVRTWRGPRIVSEGDSWFQYPTSLQDIIDHLMQDHAILSLGAAGDELSDIGRQNEILFNIEAEGAAALLLSAGGNDLFDKGQLGRLIEDPFPGATGADLVGATFDAFLQHMIDQYLDLFRKVHRAFPHLHILIHGYGPAFPRDGAWIEKPLTKRGVPRQIQHGVVIEILRRFNAALAKLAARDEFDGRIAHIDVTDIGTDPGQWYDEIHLDGPTYAHVAERFRAELRRRIPTVESLPLGPVHEDMIESALTVGDLRARFRTPKGAPDFSAGYCRESLELLDQALAEKVVAPPEVPVDAAGASAFRLRAAKILELLGGEPDETPVDTGIFGEAEAFVFTDGTRPALYVQDGTVDTSDPRLVRSGWKDRVEAHKDDIHRLIGATGRIIRGSNRSGLEVYGSAWMLERGRVATARHVLEEMMDEVDDDFIFRSTFFVDFSVEADRGVDATKVFRIDALDWTSDDLIARTVHPPHLDAAVFELAPNGLSDFPDPIPLATAADGDVILANEAFFNVGHPGTPRGSWLSDGDDGNPDTVSRAIIFALIGDQFGVKRLSPGMIEVHPGLFPGDTRKHVVTHDATTLGGSSGSGLMAEGGNGMVMAGLHFAGLFGTRNYAHWVPAIREPLE